MSFTKGPWEFDDSLDTNDDFRYRVVEKQTGLHFVIAMTCFSGADDITNGGSAEANARLIAAAPELLAALEVAVRQNSHNMIMTGDELRQCEAAINKARGQS